MEYTVEKEGVVKRGKAKDEEGKNSTTTDAEEERDVQERVGCSGALLGAGVEKAEERGRGKVSSSTILSRDSKNAPIPKKPRRTYFQHGC